MGIGLESEGPEFGFHLDSSRCVTLGSLLCFSELQFPHLEIGSHDWLYHTALSIGSSESLCWEHFHCPNCLIKTPDVILDSSFSFLRSLSLHPVGLIFKVFRESGCFLSCTWLPPWSSPLSFTWTSAVACTPVPQLQT